MNKKGDYLSMVEIGKLLKQKAQELGISDADVARRSGIAERTYSYYTSDQRRPPYDKLIKICRTLNVTPNYLLGFGEGDKISSELLESIVSRTLECLGECESTNNNGLDFQQTSMVIVNLYEHAIKEGISDIPKSQIKQNIDLLLASNR